MHAMKRLLVALLFLVACTTQPAPSQTSPSPDQSPLTTPTTVANGCVQPADPNSHVYNPNRLKVLQPCITVTGTIDFIRKEADGDYHIGLKLDSQFAGLVNSCNSTCANGAEHGDLVVEPVCELTVTQADAIATCAGYHNTMVIPPVGSHVSVRGAYVLDTAHGWLEIHPAVEIKVA